MGMKLSQNFAYFFSFGYMPSTRIDSSQGGSIYGILRILYIMSGYGYTNLYSHQQCIGSCRSHNFPSIDSIFGNVHSFWHKTI